MDLLTFMANACVYAQEHIDDADAWDTSVGHREELLQCTSFQMACFLSQNTVDGSDGVEWEVVLSELCQHPMKTETEWRAILNDQAAVYGGWLFDTNNETAKLKEELEALREELRTTSPQDIGDFHASPEGERLRALESLEEEMVKLGAVLGKDAMIPQSSARCLWFNGREYFIP